MGKVAGRLVRQDEGWKDRSPQCPVGRESAGCLDGCSFGFGDCSCLRLICKPVLRLLGCGWL